MPRRRAELDDAAAFTLAAVLVCLLLAVAIAAGVLSFGALEQLAITCGFDKRSAWLLPVVIDAGAAGSSVVWLGKFLLRDRDGARRYARVLTLTLLATSVAGNALQHFLSAYRLEPHWGVVVAVSAVAPAVLGALVHLGALIVGRPGGEQAEQPDPPVELPADWPTDGPTPELLDALDVIEALAGQEHDEVTETTPVGLRVVADPEPGLPDRRAFVDTTDTDAIVADLRTLALRLGRTFSRDEVRSMYRIGAVRAQDARRVLGWAIDPTDTDREVNGAVR